MKPESQNPVNEESEQFWWCNVHKRRATYFYDSIVYVRCDPKLGGIMLPCQCVNLTGIAEITDLVERAEKV